MQRQELKTFHEYVRSVYDLDPKPVSKGDTVKLYRVILHHWELLSKKTPAEVGRREVHAEPSEFEYDH